MKPTFQTLPICDLGVILVLSFPDLTTKEGHRALSEPLSRCVKLLLMMAVSLQVAKEHYFHEDKTSGFVTWRSHNKIKPHYTTADMTCCALFAGL